jgi:hypothetical protein
MTDRVQSLTVVFEKELRTDDAQAYVDAISIMRGVASVELGPVCDIAHYAAREDVRRELWDLLRPLLVSHRGHDRQLAIEEFMKLAQKYQARRG